MVVTAEQYRNMKAVRVDRKENTLTIHIDPLAKPRMSQRDKWNPTARAKRYYEFRRKLHAVRDQHKVNLPEVLDATFVCPMPASWSKKKRKEMDGIAKQSRPDLSNFVKALEDCLCEEDSYIWRYENVEKVWGEKGMIIIRQI